MLKVFCIDLYVILVPGATLLVFTRVVAKKIGILPNVLHEPFVVSTLVGESGVTKRVYRNFPIMLPNRVSYVD